MEKNNYNAAEDNREVSVEVCNNKGIITLTKPKSLNAITIPMIRTISKSLSEWEDKMALVVVKSGSAKAFCAGGDIFKITQGGPTNPQYGIDTFYNFYKIIYVINQYKIPYITLVDGITMGGGVGLSWPGKYCIASERSVFAMPETSIGFFPDVGTCYFFSRLEQHLGLYLALTGQRLQGKDAVKVGYATHYVESKHFPALFNDILSLEGNVETVIERYSQDLSDYNFSLSPYQQLIDKCFSAETVEHIMERLQSEGSEFSKLTLKQLNKMSPIALKIVKLQLEKASTMTLKECLRMDYRLGKAAVKAISSRDFYEGTRAFKEKRVPKWNPEKLEDVSDEMVEKLFSSLRPEEELDIKDMK